MTRKKTEEDEEYSRLLTKDEWREQDGVEFRERPPVWTADSRKSLFKGVGAFMFVVLIFAVMGYLVRDDFVVEGASGAAGAEAHTIKISDNIIEPLTITIDLPETHQEEDVPFVLEAVAQTQAMEIWSERWSAEDRAAVEEEPAGIVDSAETMPQEQQTSTDIQPETEPAPEPSPTDAPPADTSDGPTDSPPTDAPPSDSPTG